jgi:hypothetical protein
MAGVGRWSRCEPVSDAADAAISRILHVWLGGALVCTGVVAMGFCLEVTLAAGIAADGEFRAATRIGNGSGVVGKTSGRK